MKQETIGNVEFTTDGERLTLRYARQFRRRAAFILLLITLLAVTLLIYPVREFSRGNWGALPLGLFLLTLGSFVTVAAISGWVHLGLFAWRHIVFDREAGTCTIPRWLWRPIVLPLGEIEHVLLRRTRKDGGERYAASGTDGANTWSAYYSEGNSILLVVRGSPKRFQRLWGRLGLTSGAEPVARQIAAFIGRTLERRPSRQFNREPHNAA